MKHVITTKDVSSLSSVEYDRLIFDTEKNKLYFKDGETPIVGPANNEIWYTTVNGEADNYTDASSLGVTYSGPTLVSNVYENGKGIMTFDADITELGCSSNLTTSSILFYNNTNFNSIILPNSVKSLGIMTFQDCTNLTSIVIPDGVTDFGMMNTFANCSSLTSVVIPDGVTAIGTQAFISCTSLTCVTIGNGVTTIGSVAFSDCQNLTTITYNGTVEQWNAITKSSDWHNKVPATTVVTCTDGTASLD